MGGLREKVSGFFGLKNKVNRLALPLVAAAGLVAGRGLALAQNTPNNVTTPNPAHEVTVTLSGPCAYANSWNGETYTTNDVFTQIWNFNPDRFTPDLNLAGALDDRWGTIAFFAGTNSVTDTSIYFYPDIVDLYPMVSCGNLDVNGMDGAIYPVAPLSDGSLKSALHGLASFSPANPHFAVIDGPLGSNYQLRGNVTNVMMNLAGQPVLSISQNGANTVVSYSTTNALPGVFTLLSKTSLGLGRWSSVTNAVMSTNGNTITYTFPAQIGTANVVPTPPAKVFYGLGL